MARGNQGGSRRRTVQTQTHEPDDSGNYDAPDSAERPARGAHPDAEYSDENRGLSTVGGDTENRGELSNAAQRSGAMAEIQAAVLMAMRYPRNEDDAHGRLMKSCTRPSFQEAARYKYPRGDTQISGPSVHLARESARCWRNIRYGFIVIYEDEQRVQLRGYAWDLETGLKVEQDAAFRKLIYRKRGGWIKPDERELRELINKHGAIAERNCILKVLPPWLTEDAENSCVENQRKKINDNLDQSKRDILAAFAPFNVLGSMIEEYLGHVLTEVTAEEIADLRGMYSAIRDGHTRWSEFVDQKRDAEAAATGAAPADGSSAGKATGPNKVTSDDLLRRAGEAERQPTAEELKAEYERKLAALAAADKKADSTPSNSAATAAGPVQTAHAPVADAAAAERARQITGGASPTSQPPQSAAGSGDAKSSGPAAVDAEGLKRLLTQRPSGLRRIDWYWEHIRTLPLELLGLLSDEITADRSLSDDDINVLDEKITERRGQ